MLRVSSRLSAALLVLAVAAGRPALCAGWMPTPDARMACCADGQACAMHHPDSGRASPLTQTQADSCCAASEGNDRTPSSSSFVLSSTNDSFTPALLTAPTVRSARDAWRTTVPIPGAHVARHLLLSVLLV